MQKPQKSNFQFQAPKNHWKISSQKHQTRLTWKPLQYHENYVWAPLTIYIAHFHNIAQNKTPRPKFEIFKFELFALKIQNCSILFFWDLGYYLGPKIQQIDYWA